MFLSAGLLQYKCAADSDPFVKELVELCVCFWIWQTWLLHPFWDDSINIAGWFRNVCSSATSSLADSNDSSEWLSFFLQGNNLGILDIELLTNLMSGPDNNWIVFKLILWFDLILSDQEFVNRKSDSSKAYHDGWKAFIGLTGNSEPKNTTFSLKAVTSCARVVSLSAQHSSTFFWMKYPVNQDDLMSTN
jgi:hypothetical protein